MPSRAHGHAIRAGHNTHGRTTPVGAGENRDRPGRAPENDVKVDATDDGGQGDAKGAPGAAAPEHAAPEHNAPGAHGAVGAARSPRRTTHNRPAHHKEASRPGTGADSGFADADDPALPPEAAAAIKEAGELQNAAGQASKPRTTTPGTTTPGTTNPGTTTPGNTNPGNTNPGNTAPGTTAPGNATRPGTAPAGAPAAPRSTTRNRPANPTSDRSTNQTSTRRIGRMAAPRAIPAAFFNSGPATQGSRLVLHTVAGTSPQHTVVLQCDPTGGTHPKAAEACADVAKAGGNLAQMPAGAAPRACFMIYAPVTVTAQGKWQGQPVRFTKKYPNTCVMHDKTGSVFDF
jgi:hypothetical protein